MNKGPEFDTKDSEVFFQQNCALEATPNCYTVCSMMHTIKISVNSLVQKLPVECLLKSICNLFKNSKRCEKNIKIKLFPTKYHVTTKLVTK